MSNYTRTHKKPKNSMLKIEKTPNNAMQPPFNIIIMPQGKFPKRRHLNRYEDY